MEKNNTEKLKEVLSQTISQEGIEKKLKENSNEKPNETNKTKPKSSSSSKKAKSINPELSIPKVTPQAKPKIKNTNDMRFINYLIYSLCLIIIITLSTIIYLLLEKDKQVVPPVEPKIKKEVIIKKVIEPKEVEVIKEKVVTKVETKIVDLDNKNFRKFYYTQKAKVVKCYDFKANSSLLTPTCQQKITDFVKNTKNLTRLEIIAVVANADNVVFNKIKDDINKQPKAVQNRVKEYLIRGFSRQRVIETASFIRENLNDYAVVTPTNYYVKSSKDNKGIIIKGFYTTEGK
ncbi:hypothetical protein CRV01_04065 [Arcobacter sp. CECT 8983]|uniref:hypothetical protein n=1 Tax=Arcobacter sp. CECT 8983 TaxID=2044508 RepID=UPI00100A7C38|nr:hypothetical protein [Arcobacter sp. CECT 8983]RXJ90340.1 hypothetical protein CRV01_04065 [Arcobacter sp. CECT 8983]